MTATVFGAADKVSKSGDTMSGPLTLQANPPLVVSSGAGTGKVLTSDASGNVTLQNPSTSAASPGLLYIGTGRAVTGTDLTSGAAGNLQGLFLNPATTGWDMTGLSYLGVTNFNVEGKAGGSIGWTGNLVVPAGFIKTDSGTPPADGIQVYGQSGSETQGLTFRGVSFKGGNSNAVVHMGGRQRNCLLEDVYIQNTSAAANTYALVLDAGIVNFNSENNDFYRVRLAGGWACLGLSTGDLGQHANDSSWYDLRTATTGSYAVVNKGGSNHTFYNYYDRSGTGPSVATVWNNSGVLVFSGGEDLNNNTSGACHQVDSAGTTIIRDRILTATTGQVALIISGRMIYEGRCRLNGGTAQVNSGGTLDISDDRISPGGLTITGSGTVYMPANGYKTNNPPTFSAFTGTIINVPLPGVVASKSATGQTSTQTLTWTPPAQNCSFRASVMIHPTTAGTSTIAAISFTERGGSARSYNIACLRQDGSSTAFQYNNANLDTYLGQVTSMTDASGSNVTVTVTPTGSTYRYSIVIEQLTSS